MSYLNQDGLTILMHGEQGQTLDGGGTAVSSVKTLTVDLNLTADKAPSVNDSFIPSGAAIVRATAVVKTAAAGGTSVNIGLAQQDGTVIDADGIDASVATAAMAANRMVACDGALVGGTATVSSDAYITTATTGTYTAGVVKLVVEYIEV